MNQRKEYQGCEIGDWTYGSPEVLRWNAETKLRIGKFCCFARGIRIVVGGEHHHEWVTTYPLDLFLQEERGSAKEPATKGDITIGNDVWVGIGAVILSGVTIGDGAVIGAGSVVTRPIPPYTIAAGNPARPIRKRFEEPVIQALLQTGWWDWPTAKIKKAMPLLQSGDLAGFLAKYGPGGATDR